MGKGTEGAALAAGCHRWRASYVPCAVFAERFGGNKHPAVAQSSDGALSPRLEQCVLTFE